MIKMGISHEEETKRLQALQREYGHDYIYQKAYPWRIRIYYGENQLLVRPMMHKSQIMQVEMIWLRQIKDISNAQLIGDTVLEAIEHIRISPIDVRSPVEREEDAIYHATKCKSYNALGRKFLMNF